MTRPLLSTIGAAGLLWGSMSLAAAQDSPESPTTGGSSPQTAKINELIAKGWESAGIKKPAERASDHEFMRRAFIDLIGRIPTPDEIRDFDRDRSNTRRAKLVNRLLNDSHYEIKDQTGRAMTAVPGLKLNPADPSAGKRAAPGINYNDAYAQNFADLWTTWMLTRSNTHPQYREQYREWLVSQFKNDRPWNQIIQDVIGASGRTGSNNAVVFVMRHLGDPLIDADARRRGEKEELGKDGKFDAVPVTSRVTKLFLGIQSQCVQCHNHPFNKEYVQSDFWGINGFFRQTDRSGNTNVPVMRNNQTGEYAPVAQLELRDMPEWNVEPIHPSGVGKGMVRYERRDGQKSASLPMMLRDLAQFENGDRMSGKQLLSGEIPSKYSGKSRREVLGIWVTEHDNFSRAFVNRMWGHLFGRGLNKEPNVDDFNSNNEVVHPELLNYLAEEFKKYNYDPKKLLEWICNSNAYNLSHVANKAYAAQEFDPYFARMPLKAMSPEVMFDSLAIATRIETRKESEYNRLKNEWTQKLTQNFGDDEGNEINFNGTVIQALLMMNGREINNEIGGAKKSGGIVEDVLKRTGTNAGLVYQELFLMTVSRKPTPAEVARLEEVRTGKARISVDPPPPPAKGTRPLPNRPPTSTAVPGAGADHLSFYQDVFWALLNSAEFLLNH